MYFSAITQDKGAVWPIRENKNRLTKNFRQFMRISLVTLFILSFTAQLLLAGRVKAQDMTIEKVTVSLADEDLTSAFKQIEKQTSLRFFYRKTEIKLLEKFNLLPARRTIEQTLYTLLHNRGFTFRQIDQNILVEVKTEEAIETRKITGKIYDADNRQPLPLATIELLRTQDLQLVGRALSDSSGSFELTTRDNADHTIRVSLMGYHLYKAVIAKGSDITLPGIYLEPDPKVLKEVVLAAKSPLVKQEVDRLVYNVQSDPDSKTSTVLDMMAKVPLLSVDAEGNIKLKGSSSFKVLIDGKSSSLVVNDPKEIFRSMAASSIASIEVITVPPARYDNEGLAGIINVVTVKKKIDGYNGNVSFQYKDPNGPRSSANFTLKSGRFAMSALGAYNIYNIPQMEFSLIRKNAVSSETLNQQGTAHTDTDEGIFFSQYSYEMDSLTLLTAVINYSKLKGHRIGRLSTLQTDPVSQSFTFDNDGRSRQEQYDLGLDYQRGFRHRKNQLLSFSYRFSNNDYNQFNNLFASKQVNSGAGNYTQQNKLGAKDQTLQLDYTQPIGNVVMETGAKIIERNNTSEYSSTLYSEVNHFDYQQKIFALYNSYQFSLHNWTFKAGARFELTSMKANFSTGGAILLPDYNRLAPSIAIQKKISQLASINFGYSQRIRRPGINQLNPFVDRQNAGYISYGNPLLQPELNHSFSVNYSLYSSWSLNTGLSYSFSNNSIQNTSVLKPDGILNNTYGNLGKNATLATYISTNFDVSRRISVNVNAEIRHMHLTGMIYNSYFTKNALGGNSIVTINYKWNHDWRTGFVFQYYSPQITLQSTSSSYYYTSFSVAKSLLKKKLTISASASNPFSQYMNYKFNYTDPNYTQITQNDIVYRRFNIILNYTFGKLRDAAVKKNKKPVKNDDISTTTAPVVPGN